MKLSKFTAGWTGVISEFPCSAPQFFYKWII